MYPQHTLDGYTITYDADQDKNTISFIYCLSDECRDGTKWVGKLSEDGVCWACGSTNVTRKMPRGW